MTAIKKENTPKILTAFVSKISNFSHSLKCSILQHFIILKSKFCQVFNFINFSFLSPQEKHVKKVSKFLV